MANNSNTLSATLEVKDSFTSQLNKFKNALNNTETAYNRFATKLTNTSEKIEKSLDTINRKMEQTSNKIISQGDKVSNSLIKSSQTTEKAQEKQINDLLSKYTKMGGDIESIFRKVNKDAEYLNKTGLNLNIKNSGGNGHSMSHGGVFSGFKEDYAVNSLLGGNFEMMLMNLGIIGGLLGGANKILTSLDGWAQQGFNAMNSLSTGLLSVDGLKEGIQNAGQFENNRVAMDVLYGNDKVKGLEYYQMGTQLAKDTPYDEIGVGELQKKLAGSHVEYSKDDLMTILDLASVKPELGAGHVGFSIIDACDLFLSEKLRLIS